MALQPRSDPESTGKPPLSCRTPIASTARTRHPRVKERLDSGSEAGLAVKPGMTEKRARNDGGGDSVMPDTDLQCALTQLPQKEYSSLHPI